ncbi:MAG: TerB family tellurite resistance protein, partial [Rubrobacter sp.]
LPTRPPDPEKVLRPSGREDIPCLNRGQLGLVNAYDRNARAGYFQKKYPGLPPDEIAGTLISVTARYASVAGGVAGATASAAQVSTLTTAGMTAPIFVRAVGSEMIYLARIQLRLILDLSVVYDLQLDPDDPEDILMVFGYAMGVAPTELVGAAARQAARGGTHTLVKKYVSKNMLKAVQNFAKKLGFKILQKTMLKYAVPVASAAVGSGYNYVSTRSLGGIAKAHFKNRRKFTKELQNLISRKNTYDLIFPAAAMYVANLDGELSPKEREFYKAMLSRMSFDEHTPEEFQRLLDDGEDLIEVAAGIEDPAMRRSLMEMMVLMAVCDGELADEERDFLARISDRLEIPLDMNEVERGTEEYRIAVKQNVFGRTAAGIGGAAVTVGGKAALLGGKMRGRFGGAFGRKKPSEEAATVMCPGCLEEIPAAHKFCPECGQPATVASGAAI